MTIVTMTEKFAVWVGMWHKHYDTEADRAIAFENFVKNDEAYDSHNAKMKSWTLGHNEFSDLSWEQFSRQHLGLATPLDDKEMKFDFSLLNATNLAAELDWVAKGAVTPVKNQASCGSCWTFSTTGAVEGAFQIATGVLLSFSEQELVSCSHEGGNGCQGGLPYKAVEWIEDHPLCLEADYPYTSGGGSNGVCKTSCAGKAKVGGVYNVPRSETALMAALNKGPVSIAIEADKRAFQGYRGGVLDNSACGTQLDHAVLLVAYGTDGKDYWKIKNSWGPSWGEGGYIRFVRGKNQCGLTGMACYPTGVTAVGPIPGPSPPGPVPPPAPAKPCWFDFECPCGKCVKTDIWKQGECSHCEEVVV